MTWPSRSCIVDHQRLTTIQVCQRLTTFVWRWQIFIYRLAGDLYYNFLTVESPDLFSVGAYTASSKGSHDYGRTWWQTLIYFTVHRVAIWDSYQSQCCSSHWSTQSTKYCDVLKDAWHTSVYRGIWSLKIPKLDFNSPRLQSCEYVEVERCVGRFICHSLCSIKPYWIVHACVKGL